MGSIEFSTEELYKQAESFIYCLDFLAKEAERLSWLDANMLLRCASLELSDIRNDMLDGVPVVKTQAQYSDFFKSFRLFLKASISSSPEQIEKILCVLEDINRVKEQDYVH